MDFDSLSFQVEVILGKAEMLAAVFSELQPGDIFLLEQKATDPLEIQVCGEKWRSGIPGLYEMNKAVRLV